MDEKWNSNIIRTAPLSLTTKAMALSRTMYGYYVSGRTRRMDETLDYCLFFVLTNNPYIGRTDG
jgi:hypothetical protein